MKCARGERKSKKRRAARLESRKQGADTFKQSWTSRRTYN